MGTSAIVTWARQVVTRSQLGLRLRDLVLRTGKRNLLVAREDLARRYLFGSGVEIGAMTMPLRVPPGVTVQHVDRMTRDGLIHDEGPALRAAGLDPADIPHIDVVDDAGRLAAFGDSAVDFVIANHVLEHLEDPITALESMMRIIRPGGVLFLTLPDCRFTFDAARTPTTIEHLLIDHERGPHTSRQSHYEEWAQLIERVPESRVPERAAEFAHQDARHHFHVWRLKDFLALLLAIPLPAELIHAQVYLKEFAVILRRTEVGQTSA